MGLDYDYVFKYQPCDFDVPCAATLSRPPLSVRYLLAFHSFNVYLYKKRNAYLNPCCLDISCFFSTFLDLTPLVK